MDELFRIGDFEIKMSTILYAVALMLVVRGILLMWRPSGLRGLFGGSRKSASSALLSHIAKGSLFYGTGYQTPAGNTVLQVMSSGGLDRDHGDNLLLMIDLPYYAPTHIVGVPTNMPRQLDSVRRTSLTPVSLEGDYPRHFQLFGESGKGSELRYILDPKAMAFTIDLCSNYFWEIHDNTLFILAKDGHVPLGTVDAFVEEIRPSLEQENPNPRNVNKLSYTSRSYRKVFCPICDQQLVSNNYWIECPDGHGCLMTGRDIINIRELASHTDIPLPNSKKHSHTKPESINCPYCKNKMRTNEYQHSGVFIDTCSHCGYRWLDSFELKTIMTPRHLRHSKTPAK